MYGEPLGMDVVRRADPRVVHKFRVMIDDKWHRIALPLGATLIHVGEAEANSHGKSLHFWAEVSDAPAYPVPHMFRVYASGEQIDEPRAVWAGTFVEHGRAWHMYMMTAKGKW